MRARSVIRNYAIYLASNILNAAIPFFLLPLLTRVLPPTEYGKIAVFQALLVGLTPFLGSSWCSAATRKYFDDDAELRVFIGACLQLVLAAFFVGSLLAWSLGGLVGAWLSIPASWFFIAVVASTGTVVVQVRLDQWQVRKKAARYGSFQVSQSASNVLLSLYLVLVLLQGAEGRILAQTYTVCAFALIAALLLWRDNLLKMRGWDPAHYREALAFGVPLIPHLIGLFLLNAADRVVITSELGLDDAGLYLVAAQLAGALGLVFDAVNKAYVPWLFERLSRGHPGEMVQTVRYTYIWFGLLLAAAALVAVIGPWAVAFIAGNRYAGAGKVIGWLALGQAFVGSYYMVTSYVFYVRRTGLLSMATIASGAVNVLLLLILVPTFGLEGAAISFVAAMGLRFLLVWWLAHRVHPMPWNTFRVVAEPLPPL